MTGAHVVLRYQGVDYDFVQDEGWDSFSSDDLSGSIKYMWTEGNYGCDCNRSQFIDSYCDDPPDFPNRDGSPYQEGDEWYGMPCGETIELVSLAVIENDVETPIALGPTPAERLAAIGLKTC